MRNLERIRASIIHSFKKNPHKFYATHYPGGKTISYKDFVSGKIPDTGTLKMLVSVGNKHVREVVFDLERDKIVGLG